MIACGSSYFAAMATVWYFKHLKCFRKVNVYDPADLEPEDITDNEAVVMISQSGETKDLINIVQECHKKENVKTVGIINVEGSTLARKTDYPIYIKVGREVSVAATKSFFHQVLNLIYYCTLVAEKKSSAEFSAIK
jgi:glucosamine--fructose-6-phosphate aminotransferase (isomerizing)